MLWHLAYEKVRPYVVRVETMSGFGTGFLFAYNKNRKIAAIATASHVIESAVDWKQPLKIWHPESKKTSFLDEGSRAAWLDRKHDAATILISANRFEFPADVLALLPEGKMKKRGVQVAWMGFPHLQPTEICFFSGSISASLDDEDSYLIDGVAINGVSGGPVFDEMLNKQDAPQIVGVVSAYHANRLYGESLPGLLKAQDLTAFHDSMQSLKSIDEAKESEQEQQKQVQQSVQPVVPDLAEPPAKPEGGVQS